MDLEKQNENISLLCDIIEVWQALSKQWPGYFNDPVDTDKEECYVRCADEFRYDDEEYRVYAEMAGLKVCPVVITHD